MTAPVAERPMVVEFVAGQPYTVLVHSASSDRWYSVDWALLADGRFKTECECPAQEFQPMRQCKHGIRAEEVIRATKEFQEMTQPKPQLHTVATDDGPQNIEQAIAAIYAKVGYVQKTRNQNLGYSFAGEKDIIEALRPAMVEEGVTVRVLNIRDVTRETIAVGRNGSMQQRTTLTATVRFAHGQSGTFVDCEALGEGMDSGDKSSNKAMTGALKYALRQTFCLETGDDPDDSHPEQQEAPQARPAARPATEAPAPNTDVERVPDAQWKALLAALPKSGLRRADVEAELGGWGPDAMASWLDANEEKHFGHLLSDAGAK